MAKPKEAVAALPAASVALGGADLVVITRMSGSGKQTALKAFEDLGFYAVDNLPIALLPKLAGVRRDKKTERRGAVIHHIRGRAAVRGFPKIFREVKKQLDSKLVFLDA